MAFPLHGALELSEWKLAVPCQFSQFSGRRSSKTRPAFIGTSLRAAILLPMNPASFQPRYIALPVLISLAAKIESSDDDVDEFMNNPVFRLGGEAKPNIQIGRGKKWWRLEQLAARTDRAQDLPVAQTLEVSCGREGTRFVVYISWMTL